MYNVKLENYFLLTLQFWFYGT